MAKTFSKNTDVVKLRNSASAITVTTSDSEVTNTRLKGLKGAVALIIVHALDISSGDETYVFTVEGRTPSGTGSYSTLGTLTLSAALTSTAGVYLADCDLLADGVRITATLGGTTPSITYSAVLVVPGGASSVQYLPSPGTSL